MREDAALFPFDKNVLPIARHFHSLQNAYELHKVIAWRGCGATGKDAAFVCNQPEIGIPVTDQLTENNTEWNTLIVDCAGINATLESSGKLETIFRECLSQGKNVILAADGVDSCTYYDVLHKEYPTRIRYLNNSLSLERNHFKSIKYIPLSTPVLLAGGLVKTGDTLEIVLALKEQFEAHGRRISCITGSDLGMLLGCHSHNHIFESNEYSEEEKILELNQFARDVIEAERPELVVVEAPDAVMKYRNIAPNGFGIRTRMAVYALNPDFFVCSMPNDLVNTSFINYLSQGIQKQFGCDVSAVYAGNFLVDSSSIVQDQSLSYLYMNMNEVATVLQSTLQKDSIYICNTVLQGSNDLFCHISKLIEQGA